MKTWYAAHIVMVVKFKRAKQENFPAWENIVLIAADSEEEAYHKADEYGRREEGDDGGTFHWGEHPARWEYAGIRKLTECRFDSDEPCDLGEVTYLDLEFKSPLALKKYLAGQNQNVTIRDPYPESSEEIATVGNTAPTVARRKHA